MKKNRGGNKGKLQKAQRPQERNCNPEGVYSNHYFMHAATSHVGAVVKVETVQGGVYEGVFKTFSHEFDVVLELAHKVDPEDPQKFIAHECYDNLIFHIKDIVNMCAPNVEPDYAYNIANTSGFLTDTNISKCNGEVTGEKDLQPWEDPTFNGGEECDLGDTDTTQNGGWDVQDMFSANQKFGVKTSYDDTLTGYTCPLNSDTKDFKEDEAKAARIAMEIERNPSSQSRSQLENGDEDEEARFAAVMRPGSENDGSKYIPPARRNNQPHRPGGGSTRMNYPPNGNGGRPPKSNAAAQSRYSHQTSQQYHAQTYGTHPPMVRDSNSSRSSSDNKNSQMSGSQSSGMSAYAPANVHGPPQRSSYPPNTAATGPSVANHTPQNVSSLPPQSKSQRTSPISVNTLPNGNAGADYQPKSMPPISPSPPHQYHNQSQSPNAAGNNALNAAQQSQRKHQGHHPSHHHHQGNARAGREDQINEFRKFGTDFNLSYDVKHKDAGDGPKQIQVVTNRNKSPPLSQPPATERNVVPVTIMPTLPPSKYTTSGPLTTPPQQPPVLGSTVSVMTTAGSVPPPPVPVQVQVQVQVPTTQVGHKQQQQQHQIVMPPTYPPTMQLQQRGDPPMLLQHQAPPMTPTAPPPPHPAHHPQSMQPSPQQQQQQAMMQQKQTPPPPHKVHMHPPPQQPPPVQLQQHSPPHPPNTVITMPSAPVVAVTASAPPLQSIVSQPTVPQQGVVTPPSLAGGLPQRPPMQQQQPPPPPLKSRPPSTVSPPVLSTSPPSAPEGTSETDSAKGKDSADVAVDDVSQRVKNVRLNPDAKEYIPAVKSYTPISRSPSTPTQSRPHSPHTPSGYSIHPGNTPVPAGIPMMMPTAYVVAATPGHVPPPQAQNRMRKTPVNSHRTSEYHTSNIPVSAVTGQPLLAPPLHLSQSHISHGASFSMPAYAHYPQLVTSHHSPLQMIRMVQPGSMVPLVPSSMGYHEPGTNATAVYVNQGSSAAVAMAHHTANVHHPQQHPPPSTAPSPSQTPQGPPQSHTPNNYQHPPLAAQSASPYGTPIMCPVIAQPSHGPPHMVNAQQAQQHATAVQQYMAAQHQSVTPPHHLLSLIPHTS